MANKTTENTKGRDRNRLPFILLGSVALIVVWFILWKTLGDIVVASPIETMTALFKLLGTADLWQDLGTSLVRIMIGVLAGSITGSALGILAGLNDRLRAFFEPVRWVVMTTPSIIILVLILLLFGMGTLEVIAMTYIITIPFSYVNALEGIQALDQRILEMARVYNIPRRLRLTNIYLPGIGAATMAGLTLSVGIGMRAGILAEFMGANEGIGHQLYVSWIHLNTPELYSWILLTFGLLSVVEFGVLRPLRHFLLKWQVAA